MRYIKKLTDIPQLSEAERTALAPVADAYAFRVSDYYLKLINWDDPLDPIRQLVIPRADELGDWGKLDASNEAANTVMRGVQHKYPDTALLLCNEVCGAYCRYCFRKRLFMNDNDEASKDLTPGIDYIRVHPEITNVLLTETARAEQQRIATSEQHVGDLGVGADVVNAGRQVLARRVVVVH
ncbi:MAG: hypothetical protein KJ702_07330, partial [Gammaproteobacteria bacterium]|nr:hypothetical protein [Gammaproteobacteria bacterium]